ncbi:hypothetical protein [Terriglobus aquaticus]|uniref:Uncharacterized protein n=1 Tax=Terriglobus aquaticus TaxID=940139 RepID=A0ABW9KHD7_9BACT|nr:hypothetical protein [Terriglobus aquaticus]
MSEPAEPVQPLPTSSGNIVSNAAKGAWDEVAGKDNVFKGAIKTFTGKNAYESEKVEQSYKMLTPEGMISASALSALQAGQHQEITRGNAAMQVTQDRYTFIDGNEIQRILQTQREETHGDANFSWLANRNIAVQGNEEHLTYGDLDTYVRGESVEMFVGKHEVTAPEEFEWKQLERGFSYLKQDMMVAGLDLHVSQIDVHQVDVEVSGLETKVHGGSHDLRGEGVKIHAFFSRIGSHLEATLHANPLISLGLDIPF